MKGNHFFSEFVFGEKNVFSVLLDYNKQITDKHYSSTSYINGAHLTKIWSDLLQSFLNVLTCLIPESKKKQLPASRAAFSLSPYHSSNRER